jgi:hypothetical protein
MAIAFDASTDGNFTSGTSRTFSHTCTGSDRILFVQAIINTNSDIVTGVTYNGVSMTQVATVSPNANRRIYLYYLIGPNTGANNVVITTSVSAAIGGNAASYTGVAQSGTIIDVSTTATDTSSPVDTTLTTTVDNCWAILLTTTDSTTAFTASTNSTFRRANTTYVDGRIFDSNAAVTPAGSFTMTVTNTNVNGTSPAGTIMAAFAPVTGGGVVKPQFLGFSHL